MSLTPATKAIILREAHKDFALLQLRIADYNEMLADCAKHGYRAQYCIHGTNQWTDYDNICGYCENGDDPRNQTFTDVLRNTLDEYRRRQAKLKDNSQNLLNVSMSLVAMGLYDLATKTTLDAIEEILGRFAA